MNNQTAAENSVPSTEAISQPDNEILAVRELIAQTQIEPRLVRADECASDEPDHPDIAPTSGSNGSIYAKASALLSILSRKVMHRMLAYRPDRKAILWTSLVLLLLLQPFFVVGWALFIVAVLVSVLLFLGADTFWRRVISAYGFYAARFPQAARVLKLRAYVVNRKWERLLRWLPAALADQLRCPNLREIIAADVRHVAAMDSRLSRLEQEE